MRNKLARCARVERAHETSFLLVTCLENLPFLFTKILLTGFFLFVLIFFFPPVIGKVEKKTRRTRKNKRTHHLKPERTVREGKPNVTYMTGGSLLRRGSPLHTCPLQFIHSPAATGGAAKKKGSTKQGESNSVSFPLHFFSYLLPFLLVNRCGTYIYCKAKKRKTAGETHKS